MKTLSRRVATRHVPGPPTKAPIINFVCYAHPTEPVLIRRTGWEIADDVHDDYADSISRDNGKTWSPPAVVARRKAVPGGHILTQEGGAVYLPDRDELIAVTYETLQPSDRENFAVELTVLRPRITQCRPADLNTAAPFSSDFGFKQGLALSFLHPIEDSRGRVLVPAFYNQCEASKDGPLHKLGIEFRKDMPEVTVDFPASLLIIGDRDAAGRLKWRLGGPVPCANEKSSRGLCEGTVAELKDGRLMMALRGSNNLWPERPSYKWLTMSKDGGETWTEAEPLRCDDGSVIESSATGSLLFRSIKTGRLYWLGNLCVDGARANGNYPRNNLVIARVNESGTPTLERASLTVVDTQGPGEPDTVQMSNFRLYQDRATGDAVFYLTRYAERGHTTHTDWMLGDQYEYRVAID